MMKPRRTIKFEETIQVKEIETIEDPIDNTKARRASWDPYINNEDLARPMLKQQGKVTKIVAIVGLGIVVLVVVIALAVVFSQKSTTTPDESLTYNQICAAGSKQCKSSQGLSCPSGFCSCNWPLSWNSASSICKLLLYNGTCISSSQCDNTTGLSCTNSRCQCDAYHTWNTTGASCIFIQNNTLTYGDPCVINGGQCNAQAGLTCTGACNCTNGKSWNVSQCSCATGKFLNSSGYCENLHKFNESCTSSGFECDTSRKLFCNNSYCSCDQQNFYWEVLSEACEPRLNYSQVCWANNQCAQTLFCSGHPNYCNCPTVLPDHTCNCYDTMYYDSSIRQCMNRSSLGGPCQTGNNYTCLSTLYCPSGTCLCPSGTSWFSSNSTCL